MPQRGMLSPPSSVGLVQGSYGNSQGQRWSELDNPNGPDGGYAGLLRQLMASQASGGGARGFGGGGPVPPPSPGLGQGGYGSSGNPGPGFGVIGNPNNAPQPGLGTGAPSPVMYEDYSSGYPGRFDDPVIALLQAILSRRNPNGM